jgi:hypothetical protein
MPAQRPAVGIAAPRRADVCRFFLIPFFKNHAADLKYPLDRSLIISYENEIHFYKIHNKIVLLWDGVSFAGA